MDHKKPEDLQKDCDKSDGELVRRRGYRRSTDQLNAPTSGIPALQWYLGSLKAGVAKHLEALGLGLFFEEPLCNG